MATIMLSRVAPELRATLFYFTQYMGAGVAAVVLPIWLAGHNISPEQIGLINSLPVLAVLAINVLVGRIADRASDWRGVIVIGALIAGVVPIGLFFVNEFWGILLVWTLAVLPGSVINPITDAATMRMTARNGTSFGAIRAWGTVGYMLVNFVTGFIVVVFGAASFVPLFVGFCLLRAAVAFTLPRFRAPAHETTLAETSASARHFRDLFAPWFFLPMFSFAAIAGTHMILTVFAALLWKEQGLSEAVIGPLIALSAASEALLLFVWRRTGNTVDARTMLLAAALAGTARWIIMAFEPGLPLLVVLQACHSFTYALALLGIIQFIAEGSNEEIAAQAQSLSATLQQLVIMLTITGFGWLVANWGARAFLGAAALSVFAAALIPLSRRLQPKH